MQSTTSNTTTTYMNTQATTHSKHRTTHRIAMLTMLLVSVVMGVKGQTATTYADGVYKIYWQWDQRGYLAYHADYPTQPQLAGVVNHNPDGHYALTDEGVNIAWYLYTSNKTKKSYVFEATTGKFITIDPNTSVHGGPACVLSETISGYAQLDLYATTNTDAYMLRYVHNGTNYQFCSGCGKNKGDNPVRFVTNDQGDGGVPFVFVSENVTITDDIKNAAITKIADFEESLPGITVTGWDVKITPPADATIYYTTDGTDPTSTLTGYVDEVTFSHENLAAGTTIKAIAVKDGATSSVASLTLTKSAMPTYQLTDNNNQVQLTAAANTTIYYTTDGQEPTSGSTSITADNSVTLPITSQTVKAIALTEGNAKSDVLTSAHITLGVTPQVSGDTQTHSYRIVNTRRHTDNSDTRYLYPLTDDNGTYGRRMKMTDTGDNTDTSEQYWYLIDAGDGYYYIANRYTGHYIYHNTEDSPQRMELSHVRRTKFSLAPSVYVSGSMVYHSYNIIPAGNSNVSFNPHGGETGYIASYSKGDGGSHWYFTDYKEVTRCATPEIAVVGQNVSITVPDGSSVYYTTDGAAPTTSSTPYDAANPFSHETLAAGASVCAIATQTGVYNSAIGIKELQASTTPSITINGDYTKVTISNGDDNAALYYTTDGTTPSYSSTTGTGSIEIAYADCAGKTIKAFALQDGYLKSDVAELEIKELQSIDNSNFTSIAADGAYRLTEDITLSSHTSIPNFTGIFDGGHHTISGLTAPLFASTDGATIKNVVLDKVNISGGTGNVGALVGTASGATRIYNCGVLEGTVGGGDNVGSIVGELQGSARVVNCYSFADITGGTTVGGIVGNNSVAFTTADALQTLVMNCIYYGDLTGTDIYPIFGGENITNNLGVNTYNFFRYNDKTTYASYNAAQAVFKDEYLNRFEFYRHILNSHRELAAYYALGSVSRQSEIGKWVLDWDKAKYPITKAYEQDTRRTLDRAIPVTTEDYAGKQVGSINATISINGTSFSATLPVTDMDTTRWDYTYGKVVLPFANEFTGWSIDDDKAITGWRISTKDFYQDLNATFDNTEYVYAQGGNYIVPDGVTSLTLTAYVAPAVYLSDASYDVVYNGSYTSPQGRGGTAPTTYKGQTVYTNLAAAIDALTLDANTVRPYEQAIVLVGNYHYNQGLEGGVLPQSTTRSFDKNKPFTLMSADKNNDQDPDYCFYQYHKHGSGRTLVHPVRFDFLAAPGIGMAAHVENSTAVPSIGIWHCKGWFELTETYLGIMQECEIRPANFLVESPWILNGGIFEEINMSSTHEGYYENTVNSKLTYLRIGGKAYINNFYPGTQSKDASFTTPIKPVNVCGGEVVSCYMTGKQPARSITTGNVNFYCNGGYIHEFLGAYLEPLSANCDINIFADHALIDNFYGGGANENQVTPGNINITINNSYVEFFCGGPKFGNMTDGKKITVNATGCTFGEFYGGGYGGTALTRQEAVGEHTDFTGDQQYNIGFNTYTDRRLVYNETFGIPVGYALNYFMYAGGGNGGVQKFSIDYAHLSLATTRDIEITLTDCDIRKDFYGGGCQGRVDGNITSTLQDCRVGGSVFAGGYTAKATPCLVATNEKPNYSSFVLNLGFFTPFGTAKTEEFYWAAADASHAVGSADDTNKKLYTTTEKITQMGEVSGNTEITVSGNSYVAGAVYGGGNESKVVGTTTVHINATNGGHRINNVYGGANQADVDGATIVNINSGNIGNVFGANNQSGTKGSTIVVNVKGATSDYVYGGGNLAAYTGRPVVNMSAGTVKHALYGGGLGATAVVTGGTRVNMTGGTVGYTEKVDDKDVVRGGDVFGGGNAATVEGNTRVAIIGGEVKRNVYGGGNQAAVSGKTNVIIGGGPETLLEVEDSDKEEIELGAPERNGQRHQTEE